MVEFQLNYMQRRYLVSGFLAAAILAAFPFTREFGLKILNYNVAAMPMFLSVGTGVAIVLSWLGYALIKNRI